MKIVLVVLGSNTCQMGGSLSVLCPTAQLGGVSFPTIGRVTSSQPTSGQQESRDHQCKSEQSCQDVADESWQADGRPPETVMTARSRDQSFDDDDVTRRVRSNDGESAPSDVGTSLQFTSSRDDVTRDDVVTSQPEPEVATASGAGRRRFRLAALTVASEVHELEHSTSMLDGDELDQLAPCSPEDNNGRPDNVSDHAESSTKISSSSGTASGRKSLLADILRARAEAQKVGGLQAAINQIIIKWQMSVITEDSLSCWYSTHRLQAYSFLFFAEMI